MQTYEAPGSHRKEGAFIAPCLFSFDGLSPSDALPMILNEGNGQLKSFKLEVNGLSLSDAYTQVSAPLPASSSTSAATKKSKLKLKATAKTEAIEAKLKRELTTAEPTSPLRTRGRSSVKPSPKTSGSAYRSSRIAWDRARSGRNESSRRCSAALVRSRRSCRSRA